MQVYGWTLRDSYAGAEQMSLLLTLSEQGKDATALRVITGAKVTDLRMHAGCTDLMMGNGRVWGAGGADALQRAGFGRQDAELLAALCGGRGAAAGE